MYQPQLDCGHLTRTYFIYPSYNLPLLILRPVPLTSETPTTPQVKISPTSPLQRDSSSVNSARLPHVLIRDLFSQRPSPTSTRDPSFSHRMRPRTHRVSSVHGPLVYSGLTISRSQSTPEPPGVLQSFRLSRGRGNSYLGVGTRMEKRRDRTVRASWSIRTRGLCRS